MAAPAPVIVVVDDDRSVRKALHRLIRAAGYQVESLEDAAAYLARQPTPPPACLILDIRMPGMSGVETAGRLCRQCPGAKVIMLTSFDDQEYVVGALQAGAHGYILKSASDETLVGAVRAVHRGERALSPPVMERVVHQFAEYSRERASRASGLSDDERRILRLLAAGASNPKIAAELYLSETTVKRKLQDIFEKLGVATRAQAAAEAVRRGLV